MKIIIGFSKSKKFLPLFGWIISLIYNTKYSHTYVRWYSVGADVDCVYEASGTSVHFTAKQIFDKKAQALHEYEINITNNQYKQLLKWCMSNAGVDYGLKQAVGIGITKIFNLKKNPLSDKNRQVCSEVVGHILNNATNLGITLDLEMAGPPEIKAFLDSVPELARKIL